MRRAVPSLPHADLGRAACFAPRLPPQGEYGANSTIVIVGHGLTLRVFMMRWFNWSVEQFLQVYNPPNASPVSHRGCSCKVYSFISRKVNNTRV